MLQGAGGIDLLENAISQAIDAVVSGELEPLTHFRHLMCEYQGKPQPHSCLFKPHHLIQEKKLFQEDVERVVNLSNVHRHTWT